MPCARTPALVVTLLVAVLVVGAASAGSALDPPSARQAGNATGTTVISVSATGDVEARPDAAVVRVASTAVTADPANATARLAANASRLHRALATVGVSPAQVRTTDFDLSRREPDRRNGSVLYVARHGFEITLDDTSRAGEVIDLAVENGATEVRGVTFALSEERRRTLRAEALAEAMADARGQAETVAAAEGLAVVGVRSIATGEPSVVPFEAETAARPGAGTEVAPGPVTVTATVQVAYNATATG